MNSKKIFYICGGITFFIFLIIFIWGIFLNSGDEMGYAVLSFYIIMPVTSFVMALILSISNAYFKWLYPIIFGLIGFFIPPIVFKGSWGWIALFFSMIPALLGLAIGLIIQLIIQKGRHLTSKPG